MHLSSLTSSTGRSSSTRRSPRGWRASRGRIAPQDWDSEWLQAEKQYFSATCPLRSFDLVISGTDA